MAIININGVDLPTPSKFKINRSDLDSEDTGRNEAGELMRNRIRQGVYKIELEFKHPSPKIHTIETAIEPSELNVTFPVPAGETTRKMYVGDRNGPEMIKYNEVTDEVYWQISFNLIEY